MDESWKKKRTKLGAFLDKHNIKQSWVQKETKLSKNTLTKLCTVHDETSYRKGPYESVMQTIENAVKKKVPNVKRSDLFNA